MFYTRLLYKYDVGPSFIRSTMYTVPDTPDMKKQTGVPFGLVCELETISNVLTTLI